MMIERMRGVGGGVGNTAIDATIGSAVDSTIDCTVDFTELPVPSALTGRSWLAGEEFVQREVSTQGASADGGRVARARRALAAAEALAWSGLGARFLATHVSCSDGSEKAKVEKPEAGDGEFEGRKAEGARSDGTGSEETGSEETGSEATGSEATGSEATGADGHSKVRARPQKKSWAGRGKKQRAQQCALDVKRFLAQRDAGEPRPMRESEVDGQVVRLDSPQRDGPGSDARHAWQANRLERSVAKAVTCARVALGDAACDAALGGGLACGALHEIQGVHFGDEVVSASACSSGGRDAEMGRGEGGWIVPFGCVLHIVRRALRHPALAGRSIAWIGSRVHPARHALRALRGGSDTANEGAGRNGPGGGWLALDDELERRSIFVADVTEPLPGGDRLAGEQVTCPARTGRAKRASRRGDQARARLWSAELAVRLHAAGVIVLDGSGFDHLAWRRLQLAVSAAHDEALERCADGGDPLCCGPLVLVITPPEGIDAESRGQVRGTTGEVRFTRRLRTAATQWSVFAEQAPGSWNTQGDESQGGWDARFRFRWRMQLAHMRPGHGSQMGLGIGRAVCAASSGDSAERLDVQSEPCGSRGAEQDIGSVHAAIANRSLFLSVDLPRTDCVDDAWEALRARTQALHVRRPEEVRVDNALRELHGGSMAMRLMEGDEAGDLFALPMPRAQRGAWEVRSA